jgi:hypothetical protein
LPEAFDSGLGDARALEVESLEHTQRLDVFQPSVGDLGAALHVEPTELAHAFELLQPRVRDAGTTR